MTDATFSVQFAGPHVTIQDGGRPGNMRFGVAASGPMDRTAFAAAHAALGNDPGAPAIEVSPGGLVLHCTGGSVTLAITGGDFIVDHAGNRSASWTALTIRKGEKLTIRAGRSGSWAYLAFCGDLRGGRWLGSQATHAPSGFGGGALKNGLSVVIADARVRDDRLGDIAQPDFAVDGAIRVVTGPQDRYFAADALGQFLSAPFKVSDACDRMGMRLVGPHLRLDDALSIPSEPIVRGSVQVSGDGVPTVLMADHQTTGGYPKIATVISIDADRLAQFRAGQTVRFATVTGGQAIEAVRQFTIRKSRYLAQISVARGTLEQRLMRENLIHGFDYD